MSVVDNANLISKVYVPRLIVSIAAVLGTMVDFAVSFIILLVMMVFYGILPGVAIVAVPLFLLLAFATVLSVGLWLAALNVKYRDVGFVIPFLTQFWLFLTPVAYSSTIIPPQWASDLWSQSNGRSDRGFPLGVAGYRQRSGATARGMEWRRF